MIEVYEAVAIIDRTVLKLPSVTVPLEKALGRILRQSVSADADFPPFNRVMMDGIAVRFDDFAKGTRSFRIVGMQAAGDPQKSLSDAGTCLEVMTGSVAPSGADVIVPYEEIEINEKDRIATVKINDLQLGKNIHLKGSDKKSGDLLITEGTEIGTPEIAVAASVGLTALKVTRNPAVAIISTGEELIDIHEQPLPHQIRRSNVYALAAELMNIGVKADLYHVNDDKDKLFTEIRKILDTHDIILTSGGVSKGKFDFLPEVLENLGIKKLFHRIKQKPGKPFWFGAKEHEKVVFAFPGNPVSTFLCFHKYFVPWLKRTLGNNRERDSKAILAEDFNIKTGLCYFLQVETHMNDQGELMAQPNIGRGSGDHANLLSSDAFLELPASTYHFKKGEVFNLISFRKP